jgi:hypothetical protein
VPKCGRPVDPPWSSDKPGTVQGLFFTRPVPGWARYDAGEEPVDARIVTPPGGGTWAHLGRTRRRESLKRLKATLTTHFVRRRTDANQPERNQ